MGCVGSFLNCFYCTRNDELEEEATLETNNVKKYSWDCRPKISNHRIEHQYETEIFKQPGSIDGQQIVIQNCKNCLIYLLDHTAALNIDDCDDCVIVCGPVKGSIFLRDTTNSTLCCVSSQLRLRDCRAIHLFSSAESEPIIENCADVKISSYTLNYDAIADHFAAACLSPDKLISKSIYDFTPSESAVPNWAPSSVDESKYVPVPNDGEKFKFSIDKENSFIRNYKMSNCNGNGNANNVSWSQ